jgi:hypothetical protein
MTQHKATNRSSFDLITSNVKNNCQKKEWIWQDNFFAIHSPGNANNETYKVYEETVSEKGRCVSILYVQNKLQAFPNRKAFFCQKL